MYCYCRGIFWEDVNANKNPYDNMRYVFDDGEMHCWDWFQDYSLSKTLLYAVPFSIIVVNFISKTILRMMTSYYGYQSKPEEVYASAVNMFWMSFINTGLVIQLVYFNWFPDEDLPLLLEEYDQFTLDWYVEIGTTVVITLMLMVLTPHLSNLGFQCLGACGRCWDRGCSFDRRKTKQIV